MGIIEIRNIKIKLECFDVGILYYSHIRFDMT